MQTQLITPQAIEKAARDIVDFWEKSTLPDSDKEKIMEMVRDHYADKDETMIDRYLSELTERAIVRNTSTTGFEQNAE